MHLTLKNRYIIHLCKCIKIQVMSRSLRQIARSSIAFRGSSSQQASPLGIAWGDAAKFRGITLLSCRGIQLRRTQAPRRFSAAIATSPWIPGRRRGGDVAVGQRSIRRPPPRCAATVVLHVVLFSRDYFWCWQILISLKFRHLQRRLIQINFDRITFVKFKNI